jgi:hypothetical protein
MAGALVMITCAAGAVVTNILAPCLWLEITLLVLMAGVTYANR